VSVALVAGASPVLAAVFAPATDEFFFAIRGQGTTHNERPVQATGGTELDFPRMAGPKPLVQRLSSSPDEITLHPRIGSLALRLCRVADGGLDAAFAGGQSRDWDLAAANLIVQEANGRMTALSGDAIEYNRREVVHGVLVAAGQDRHARIVEHFRNRPLP
jgi:myo-inositol-1(or 4)-monophosphatase